MFSYVHIATGKGGYFFSRTEHTVIIFHLVSIVKYNNIQYDMHYYYIISLKKINMKTWNNKCSNKEECDNGIPLKVTNQTDPSVKKNCSPFHKNSYDKKLS